MTPEPLMTEDEARALRQATDTAIDRFLERHPGRVGPEVAEALGTALLQGPPVSLETVGARLDALLALVTTHGPAN